VELVALGVAVIVELKDASIMALVDHVVREA
jgi:hypothetical protein